MLSEPQLSGMSPFEVRFYEATYFLKRYVKWSGPPRDSYFLKIAYFDGFLFSLVSVENMDRGIRRRLNDWLILHFFKLCVI